MGYVTEYKRHTIVDGKIGWIVVDENGHIVNKYPNKNELKDLQTEPYEMKKKYTDEELLTLMQRFYRENGRTPIKNDFDNNPRYPGSATYQIRFDSWTNALKKVGMDIYSDEKRNKLYTDVELLNFLKNFCQENERIPTAYDFANNPGYPGVSTYQRRFGSWNNALKLVGLDTSTLVKKGIVQNYDQKARLAELYIKELFQDACIDLSGNNKNNPIDGICPKGQIYDVKSSRLLNDNCFLYSFRNKEKEDIEYYFLLGFNDNYTELLHVWRVPGEIIETLSLRIGINDGSGKFNVRNMIEYEITDKFKKVVETLKKIIKENKNK